MSTLTAGHTWDELAEAVLTHDLAAQHADWHPDVIVAATPISAPPRPCRYCERYRRHCGRAHTPETAADWSRDWRGNPRPEPEPGMYLVQVDHVVYERRNGTPFTLTEALAEVAGTGNAIIRRLDGTVVVAHAGSTAAPWVHVPTGRLIQHRPARHAWRNRPEV